MSTRSPLAALALALAAGCSPPTHAIITGEVRLDGKPLKVVEGEKVMVLFLPEVNNRGDWLSQVGPDGRYRAAGADEQGLPPGRYRVAITAESASRPELARLGDKYGLADTPLAYDIRPGRPTIDLDLTLPPEPKREE